MQLAIAIKDTTPDEILKEAYHDAIGVYGWNSLGYWKDKLCAMDLADDTAPVRNKNGKRNREMTLETKLRPQSKWPPGFGPEWGEDKVDDDEDEGPILPIGRGKRRMIKKEVLETATLADIDALYGNSDEEDVRTARKVSRTALSGRFAPPLEQTPVTAATLRRLLSSSVTPGRSRTDTGIIE